MNIDNMLIATAEKLGVIDAEADTQEALIEQIITALDGKISRYEEGVKDENERLWHTMQTKLSWVGGATGWAESVNTDYTAKFRNWYTATEINPLYPIEATSVTQMFECCQSMAHHPPVTFLQPASGYAMFNGCRILEEVNMDMRLKGDCRAMCQGCYKLKKVNKVIIEGTITWAANSFNYCDKLEELNIEGTIDTAFNVSGAPVLNKASLTNVMNILSTTTSGLTCTLSKAAVDKAYETSEGANDGSASDEWNTLVNSKPNWTISLA